MAHPMTRITASVLAAATCVGLTACAAGATSSAPAGTAPAAHASYDTSTARGRVVSAVHLHTMSAKQVRKWLASDGFDATAVRYGVNTYRIVYQTVDPQGRPTSASGLVVLPRNDARQLQTVSYAHGTEVYKPDAPSTATDVWGPGAAVTYGAAGFAAVAPDYLGLGRGPGVHPWKDVPSETTASLDLLRAARQFVPRTGRTLRHEVLVTGFSQGASAALGLARALQQGADPWFRVKAVAPIAGAYDMGGAEIPALLGDRVSPKAGVVYTAYLLTSWQRLHGLYGSPSEVFLEPYASRVSKLFDGTTPGQEMAAGLPDTVDQLLTPRGFALLRHPTGAFARALRVDAEVCTAWRPDVPVRLYKISDDEQAVTTNTDHCVAAFRARGLRVPVVDVGDHMYNGSRHLAANLAGTALIVRWFGELAAK